MSSCVGCIGSSGSPTVELESEWIRLYTLKIKLAIFGLNRFQHLCNTLPCNSKVVVVRVCHLSHLLVGTLSALHVSRIFLKGHRAKAMQPYFVALVGGIAKI